MIGQGIVRLVNAGLASPPDTSGGFRAQLPKDHSLPTWTYLVVSDRMQNTLAGARGVSEMLLQIDVYGSTAAETQTLVGKINDILQGYRGTLPDDDGTVVSQCLMEDSGDIEQDDNLRLFRFMLEYRLWYRAE